MQKVVKISAVGISVCVLALFGFGSMSGLFDPAAGASDYGMPITDDAGALFFRVYLSRNLVILLAALVFLLRRQWASLAILINFSVLLPIFDACVLYRQFGREAPLGFHLGTIFVLTVLSILLWMHTANERRNTGNLAD